MNHPAFATTLFFGCMIAASASLAGTDIIKCVDAAGHTVLTDQPCAGGSEIVDAGPVPAAAIEPMAVPAPARGAAVERQAAAPQEPPRSAWAARKNPPAASTSSDAATLRTARMNLRAMDLASAQMRQHRLAGLN